MQKETTDYANLVSETKTRVIPSEARDLTKTRDRIRGTVARDLRDGVHCEVLRRLRG